MKRVTKLFFVLLFFVFSFSLVVDSGFASLRPSVMIYAKILSAIESQYHRALTVQEEEKIKAIQDEAVKKILSLLDEHSMYFSKEQAGQFLSSGFVGMVEKQCLKKENWLVSSFMLLALATLKKYQFQLSVKIKNEGNTRKILTIEF
ncbi:MAG: hypothetical protein K9M15_00300 [Candidatus Marinimicrobia bacterium]|nr:hypothetical protein [Candidatus Neomarinimicrobiota bacterium]